MHARDLPDRLVGFFSVVGTATGAIIGERRRLCAVRAHKSDASSIRGDERAAGGDLKGSRA